MQLWHILHISHTQTVGMVDFLYLFGYIRGIRIRHDSYYANTEGGLMQKYIDTIIQEIDRLMSKTYGSWPPDL